MAQCENCGTGYFLKKAFSNCEACGRQVCEACVKTIAESLSGGRTNRHSVCSQQCMVQWTMNWIAQKMNDPAFRVSKNPYDRRILQFHPSADMLVCPSEDDCKLLLSIIEQQLGRTRGYAQPPQQQQPQQYQQQYQYR